ncbi:MAG: endodeoxyribonuclease RusA [Proteobacteria bacterium]|nr:endodeoxyribonuclease RusA [Pseudomonadota bacterium]
MIEVLLPVRTWSEANLRGHWGKKARRAKKQRQAARLLVRTARVALPKFGSIAITLTRIAPRALDTDNLASGLKAVRDGVADALGVDDGSSRTKWRYAQERGKPGEFAVRVEIRAVPDDGAPPQGRNR